MAPVMMTIPAAKTRSDMTWRRHMFGTFPNPESQPRFLAWVWFPSRGSICPLNFGPPILSREWSVLKTFSRPHSDLFPKWRIFIHILLAQAGTLQLTQPADHVTPFHEPLPHRDHSPQNIFLYFTKLSCKEKNGYLPRTKIG